VKKPEGRQNVQFFYIKEIHSRPIEY